MEKVSRLFLLFLLTLNYSFLEESLPFRNVIYYGFRKSVKESRLALRKYKANFGFKLDKDSLESRVRFMLPFAKMNLVLPIVLIGKVKNYLNSRG